MKKVKLGDIGKVVTGCTPSTKKLEYYESRDYMFVGPSDIKNVMYVVSSEKHISQKAYEDHKTRFINASNLGTMVTRRLRELDEKDIKKIAETYHSYQNNESYEDIKGFCYSATLDEIKSNDYVLTPGRYVGVEDSEEDDIPFEEKMSNIISELSTQFEESHRLEE